MFFLFSLSVYSNVEVRLAQFYLSFSGLSLSSLSWRLVSSHVWKGFLYDIYVERAVVSRFPNLEISNGLGVKIQRSQPPKV